MPDELDERLAAVGKIRFRASFQLGVRERAIIERRGMDIVRHHAHEIIRDRLAPAMPRNDGRQTPYRNHPVFVAQHATATCCRTCLQKWHGIESGVELDLEKRKYVVEAICRWLLRQYSPEIPPQ